MTPLPPPSKPWDYGMLAARLAVGGILFSSGLYKAAGPVAEFAVIIDAYRILPPGLVFPAAAVMSWTQLLVGAALLSGWLTRAAAVAAAGLMLAFIAALGSTVLRGIPLEDCGCFGAGIHSTPLQTISLDSVLLILCLLLLWRGRSAAALDGWVQRGE